MPDDNDRRWVWWIWLTCGVLGVALTAAAAKLSTYIANGKHGMSGSDSIDITGDIEE